MSAPDESSVAVTPPPRTLLVDDFPALRETMARLLRAANPGWPITEADDGLQALARLEQAAFDVAVVDVSMPGMNGFELTRRIRQQWPALPVLVLSMHEEEPYALKALQSGARGYLMKDRAAAELVNAVTTVRRGGLYLSAPLAERLLVHLGGAIGIARHARLSTREFEVLRRLSRGESTVQMAQGLNLAEPDVHRSRQRILGKLDLTTLAELVRYGAEIGLGEPASPDRQPPPPHQPDGRERDRTCAGLMHG